MKFGEPAFLLLLLLPAAWLLLRLRRRERFEATLPHPDVGLIPEGSWRVHARRALPVLRGLALACLVVALARPMAGEREEVVVSEGIDIILGLDISGSMRAEDFQPDNRLAVAKEVARRFIEGRRGDRIGLVVFANGAYTQCPLTTDYPVLLQMLDKVDFGDIKDGTAVGMAIATGTNRLREASSPSKVLILLTDGRNNAGTIDPITAARLAKAVGVRIHTIAAGSTGEAPFPVDDPVFGRRYVQLPVQIDEESLREVASITGGEYFRATDAGGLAAIYQRIDEMEKTRVETRSYVDYSEFGPALLLPALALVVGELLLALGPLRKLP
ncbi:MAG: VWA domain-containing protein [Candidatus Eisenbacteria bacterium]